MQSNEQPGGEGAGGRWKMIVVILVLIGVLGVVYALTDAQFDFGGGEGATDEENGVMTKSADEESAPVEEDGKGPGADILERAGMAE